jgi:hypothetical protein
MKVKSALKGLKALKGKMVALGDFLAILITAFCIFEIKYLN